MCDPIPDEVLDLQCLANDRPGITRAWGEGIAQAATVCLEDQRHSPGAAMSVRGHRTGTCRLDWQEGDDQMRRCFNDSGYATEHGAYAIAILLAELITGWTVVERSEKGTHIDFWMGEDNEEELPFTNKVRLEVTGIRHGDDAAIAARMKEKWTRLTGTVHSLPAMVIVVEFGLPVSEVQQK